MCFSSSKPPPVKKAVLEPDISTPPTPTRILGLDQRSLNLPSVGVSDLGRNAKPPPTAMLWPTAVSSLPLQLGTPTPGPLAPQTAIGIQPGQSIGEWRALKDKGRGVGLYVA